MRDRTRQGVHAPRIDLETVRETIAYIHDDMARHPGMTRIADALAQTIREIDALPDGRGLVEVHAAPPATDTVVAFPAMRLIPWSSTS